LWSALALFSTAIAPDDPDHWVRRLPAVLNHGPVRDWMSQRDLPPPPSRTFRQMWRERESVRLR
jgi:hypothetical protein